MKRFSAVLCLVFGVAVGLATAPSCIFAQQGHAGALKPGIPYPPLERVSTEHCALQRVAAPGTSSSTYIGLPAQEARILPHGAGADEARTAAATALTEFAAQLRIPSDADLLPRATVPVGRLWHSSFQVHYYGLPLRDRSVSVVMGALNGKIVSVSSDIPATAPAAAPGDAQRWSLFASRLSAWLGEDRTLNDSAAAPELVYVATPASTSPVLAYETFVRQPSHRWRLRINALTGELLEKKEMLEFADGGSSPVTPANGQKISGRLIATVHLTTPFDSLVAVGLPHTQITVNGKQVMTNADGEWELTDATLPVTISAHLGSPYVSLLRADGANAAIQNLSVAAPYALEWTDANSDVAERDAFFSVNRIREYIRGRDPSLSGLDSLITVHVNLNQTCNAYYDPDDVSLNFFHAGNDCSNTGEISDVVYHEYGHRVIHLRYQLVRGANIANRSLNEGFADLLSAFFRDDPTIGNGFYSKDRAKILRTCDNTKSFPAAVSGDPHVTGEIIAGAIWDLRKSLGHDAAERLFHSVQYMAPDGPDETSVSATRTAFLNTLLAFLVVDDDDNDLSNGTPHMAEILQAFDNHGISIADFVSLRPEQLGDQPATATAYELRIFARYTGPVGSLDTNSVTVYYSLDHGRSFNSIAADWLHDSTFHVSIPHVPAGTIVEYYASARTSLDDGGIVTLPSPLAPYSFLVGYRSSFLEDCEGTPGWSTSIPSDAAKTGRWTLGVPYGTYSVPGEYVQQDTDHTQNGTRCYVTGNAPNADISFDDVDSGATTLTTTAYDLSPLRSPIIRYWYYYSNDQGSNPGKPIWQTLISGDDGQTWKTLQSTNESTSGWTSFLVRVSDYVTPSAHVRLRFIASDNIGALVEAGVDDLEILSGDAEGVEPSGAPAAFQLGSVYPNPVVARDMPLSLPFSLEQPEHVTLAIKNTMGENVASLVDQLLASGSYTSTWSVGSSTPAGVYWVVLRAGDKTAIRRIVVER